MRVLGICLAVLLWVGAPMLHAQQPQKPSAAQEGFVPVDQLPSNDQLPAAPLLITAYAAAWLAILLYIVSLWRRLSRVEREIAVLSQRLAGNQRGARQ